LYREGTDVSGASLISLTNAITGVVPRAAFANFITACIPQGSGLTNRMLRWKWSQFEIVLGDEPGFWPRETGL
jgi:hypothetical protein